MRIKVQNTFDPIEDLIPQKGWLYEYTEFSKDMEACPRFRFFTAACVLGAVFQNRVWIQRGDEGLLPKLFPNIWVIILAPPGRGHKTTSINMAVNCLTQATPEVRLLADKLTPESLVKTLSSPIGAEGMVRIGPSDATGMIKAPELSVFFGKQQYNTGLVSLITDLYDFRETWSSETIMRGKNTLKNVCISIIGGSTPQWLQKMLPEDAFTGGFMSRFVICEMPQLYFKRRAFPKQLKGTSDWSEIVDGMRCKLTLQGPMKWGKGTENAYEKYYENIFPTGDVQHDAYREREPEQVLKLAMLLALSEERMSIEVNDFDLARHLLEMLMKETTPRIDHLTTQPRMQTCQDIQDLMKLNGGTMSHRDIMRQLYKGLTLGAAQLSEAIQVLKISGVITQEGFKEPTYTLTGDKL